MVDDARRAALDGEWVQAIEFNQSLIDRTPRDADAYNRLGRALIELGRLSAAYDAYSGALKIDPANMIARRNLQRLETLRRTHTSEDPTDAPAEPTPTIPRTNAFIEEVGKTWVDELVEPAPIEVLAEVPSGEHLDLIVEGQRLVVTRQNGQRLGEIEAKTAERLLELINGGNRYEVYALGLSSNGVRVIIREVYKDPNLANRVSFPRQISYTRAYLRDRDQLRQRDEADFLFSDEDDDDIDEEETGGHASDEESSVDAEPDAFEEDTVVAEEEESPI
jgi:tetratricopeptide (TPR) repeat protein